MVLFYGGGGVLLRNGRERDAAVAGRDREGGTAI